MSCQRGHPAEYILVNIKRKNEGFFRWVFGAHNSKKLVLERLKELRPSLFVRDEKGLKWLAYVPPRILTHYCENMDNLRLETLVNAASDLLSQQQKECRRQQFLKHAVEKECRVYRDKLQQVTNIVRNVLESYGVKRTSHNLEAWRSGESLGREQEEGAPSSLYGSEDWVDFTRPCFDRLRACLEEVISICDTSKGSLGVEAFADEVYAQPSEYVSEVSSLTSSSTVPLKKGRNFSQEKQFMDGNSTHEWLWKHNRVTVSHAHHYSDPLASTSYWTSPKVTYLEQVDGCDMEMHSQDNRSQCRSTQSSRYQPSYKSNSSGKSALKTRMPCPDVLLYGDNAEFANCNSTIIPTKSLSVSDKQLDEVKYTNSLEQPIFYSGGDPWSVSMTTTNTV
ncbi:hypothetical protein Gasu2_24210 [Galdieria sulphuraria]|nr:hypothetical protein Gasu2_24210 [Galdieria sulphuraria]